MKKQYAFLFLLLGLMLQAQQIKSIKYVNLTKISQNIANEQLGYKVGDEIDINKINIFIKKFYAYNYFDDISVINNNGNLKIIFKEKPSISNIELYGYKTRKDDINKIKKEVGLKKGSMYSPKKIKNAKSLLLKKLENDGFINSVVEVEIEYLSQSSVSVIFNVNKGDEIIIKKVNYYGATKFDKDDFEKVTFNKEEEFIPWFITQNDGELKAEQLKYDATRIRELYLEHGYLDIDIKDPFLEVDFLSNQANLDFHISEGQQYTTNSITIYVNSEIIDAKDLYSKLRLKKNRVFNIKKLRHDVNFIKKEIANLSYAFADIKYDIKKDSKNATTDIIFNVIPGKEIFINDVKISGNSRTLDKVIRRNVYLAPKDKFNLTDLKDSTSKLKRTGFFDKVIIQEERISDNKINLHVKVQEAATGNIILGGGFGSYDKVMISGSIKDKNIFGSGLNLGVSADLSKRKSDFSIFLKNPAIYDSLYHGHISINNDKQEINNSVYELEKKSKGFSIGLGKEYFRNLKLGLTYKLSSIKENYDYQNNFKKKIGKKYYGNKKYILSSLTPYLNFDNTDDYFVPRDGIKSGMSMEYAGVGGDSKFIKSSLYLKYFYSLNDKYELDWILRYKIQANHIKDNGQIHQGDSLYLGGTSSLRGYKSYAFGPNNENGQIEDPYKFMAASAIELSFPLSNAMKMRWGVFYDYGMTGKKAFTDIKRSSAGALFEWISPFGPLQLIFANALDKKKTDDTSNFEFSLGSSF